MTTVLGDPGAVFCDSGFSITDEKSPCGLCQLYRSYVYGKTYQIQCYTPQLCDCTKQANTRNNKPIVPFIQVNDESFGQEFAPSDLLGGDPEKKMYARNAV